MNTHFDEVEDEDFWTIESFVQENFRELPRPEFEQPQFNPEEYDRVEIDSRRLFGNQDPWDFQPSEQDLLDIESAFQQGPTRSSVWQNDGRSSPWDKCAWYQPVHFFGPDWGIYIKETCVFRSAVRYASFVPRHLQATRTSRDWFNILSMAALFVYYLHEHYHHRVESLGFRLHVVTGQPLYVIYKNNVYGVLKRNLHAYPGPYINGWDPDEQIEEALANANSYLQLGSQTYKNRLFPDVVKIVKKALKSEFPYDQPGYRQASRYLTYERFRAGQNLLQARVLAGNLVNTPAKEWKCAPGMTKSFYGNRSKFWAVVDKTGRCRFPMI